MSGLSDVLAAHFPEYISGTCLCGIEVANYAVWIDHVTEAVRAAGLAVIQLPQPDSTRYEGEEHQPEDRLAWMPGDEFEVSVWHSGEVQRYGFGWGDGEPLSVAEARTIAAALLAAAEAAEQVNA